MALAKIVGFEVAPVTPRSTSLSKSPLSSRSRERVSSQIDTPASRSAFRRFVSAFTFIVSLCRGRRELFERHVGVRQPAHVHPLPGADHLLDRLSHVPHVHVHSGQYPAAGHPE